MKDDKLTAFKLIGDYNTDIRSLYEAWATTAGIEKWFLRKANFYTVPRHTREPHEFIKKEDTYDWYWHGYNDQVFESGQILESNGTDFLKFTFSGRSEVSINLQTRNGVSIVELTQQYIPAEEDPTKNLYIQCQKGWIFYLANLKSVLEGGVDLRNKKLEVGSNFK